jgi:predicted metal-dependent HD superfamily phosphohydrolase
MIMATAGHTSVAEARRGDARRGDQDSVRQTAILVDADLAILGADPQAYQAYANGVRAEYFVVDDEHWRIGRGRVLRTFLDRPRIYATEYMYDEREHRARANIEAELATLRGDAPARR